MGPSVNVETRIHSLASTEERRNRALHELEILHTLPESEFDDLVVLASEVCGAPIGLISLIDSECQWVKAAVGLTASETFYHCVLLRTRNREARPLCGARCNKGRTLQTESAGSRFSPCSFLRWYASLCW